MWKRIIDKNIDFTRNCPEFHIFTKIVIFKYNRNFFRPAASTYLENAYFYTRKSHKGITVNYCYQVDNRAQLDYILVRRKFKNGVLNAQAHNLFCSIGSDHRIVTATIRLSLRANSRTLQKKPKYDWNKLKTNPDLQDKYTVEIRNKYEVLSMNAGDDDQTQKYSYLIQANKETAEKVMPRVPKKQRKALCYDARVEMARIHLKEVDKRRAQETTKDTHLELEECKEKLDETFVETAKI